MSDSVMNGQQRSQHSRIDPRLAERRALVAEAQATAARLRTGTRIIAEFADVHDIGSPKCRLSFSVHSTTELFHTTNKEQS